MLSGLGTWVGAQKDSGEGYLEASQDPAGNNSFPGEYFI